MVRVRHPDGARFLHHMGLVTYVARFHRLFISRRVSFSWVTTAREDQGDFLPALSPGPPAAVRTMWIVTGRPQDGRRIISKTLRLTWVNKSWRSWNVGSRVSGPRLYNGHRFSRAESIFRETPSALFLRDTVIMRGWRIIRHVSRSIYLDRNCFFEMIEWEPDKVTMAATGMNQPSEISEYPSREECSCNFYTWN